MCKGSFSGFVDVLIATAIGSLAGYGYHQHSPHILLSLGLSGTVTALIVWYMIRDIELRRLECYTEESKDAKRRRK